MSFYEHAETKLYIDRLEEKVCISAPSHHAHIDNADVPTVAAELLKAAGRAELAGMIEAVEVDRTARAEREAAEKKLQERRDALAAELAEVWGQPATAYIQCPGPLRTAITRIIKLEDGASRD